LLIARRCVRPVESAKAHHSTASPKGSSTHSQPHSATGPNSASFISSSKTPTTRNTIAITPGGMGYHASAHPM
jgi:hypothetical protein